MSSLEKIIEKVPYSNGGFRRRMTAGIIVNLSVLATLYLGVTNFDLKLDEIKIILTSPLVVIVFFLLVYAAGGLVEVLADLFITRFTGNTASALTLPKRMFQKSNKFIKPILKLFAYYPGIIFILFFEWGKALTGKSSYKWDDLEKHLMPNSDKYLESLPEAIKDGVKEPFGKYGDLPWQYFSNHGANDDVKALARKLENRNKDILVVLSSLLISSFIFIFFKESNLSFKEFTGNATEIIVEVDNQILFESKILFAQFLMLIPVVLLSSYFMLVKQSILTIIEYNSLVLNDYSIKEQHNDSMHSTTTVATAPSASSDD